MPVQISVGPPVLTINQGNTFLVTDQNGEIRSDSEQGMFWNDTRFVSRYQVTANGQSWTRLSSSPMTYYSSRVYLTNQSLATEEGEILAGTLALTMSRAVEDGIHEDLDVANHNLFAVRFNLEILFHSDFADLFEVKAHAFVHRGRIDADYDRERTELRVVYSNRDFKRTVLYHILQSDSPVRTVNGRIAFDLELEPGATWHAAARGAFTKGAEPPAPDYACAFIRPETTIDQLQRAWQERPTKLESSNEDLARAFRQSVEDMGALRLWHYDFAPDVWLPAA